MRSSNISHINPSPNPRRRDFGVFPTRDDTPDLCIRFIERLERDVLFHWTEYHGRINRDDIKMRFLFLNELIRCLLRKLFARTIPRYMLIRRLRFFPRNWIPILFYSSIAVLARVIPV